VSPLNGLTAIKVDRAGGFISGAKDKIAAAKERCEACPCSGNRPVFKVAVFMIEKASVYCAVRVGIVT